MTRKELLNQWKDMVGLKELYNDTLKDLLTEGYEIDINKAMQYEEVSDIIMDVVFADIPTNQLEYHITTLVMIELLAKKVMDGIYNECIVVNRTLQ